MQTLRGEVRKRRPHLAIACVVTGLALSPAGAAAVAVACAIAAAAGAWIFGSRALLLAAAFVALPAAAGTARIQAIDRPAAAAQPGTVIDARATLLERPRPGLFGSSAPMRIDTGPASGLRILARYDGDWHPPDPGVRFRVRGLVKPPRVPASANAHTMSEANAGAPGTPGFGPLPPRPDPAGDFDFAAFLRTRGIGREVQVESLMAIGRRGGVAGLVDSMRRRAEAGIGARLASDRAALARGMVLGEDGDVDEATRDDFRRSGLAHLLAASGQNVALLCALALPLLMLVGAPQRVRIGVLLPLVAVYVALAGSGASIVRAGIMASAGLAAVALGRGSSAVYSLLLAAAITLGLNPRATGDPGWQLSFAAVVGMLALGPLIAKPLQRLPHAAAEAIGATVAATVATSPLLAHQFGAISIAALPANLIAFPAVAPIMWIGMTAATLEQVAVLGEPFALIAHTIESATAPVSDLALRWVAGVATRFGEPTWAQSDARLSWLGVAAAYALLAAIVVAAANRARLRTGWTQMRARWIAPTATRPAAGHARISTRISDAVDWLRALSPASRRAFAAPIAALAVGGVAHAVAPPAPSSHLTVDFIDVGQGDATLIRDPTGAAVLFDGGPPEARVDRTLRRLGVRKLSVVVATHQSRDHHAGLLQVVKRFPIGLFLDGRDGVRDATFEALEREVDRRRIPRRPTRAGERLTVGGMNIRILWPTPRTPNTPRNDPNKRATVAIVSEGRFDLFLSADAESEVLLPLHLPRVEAMKVPHHGSADPGLPQLLDRLRPTVATIETGRGNRYGHPTSPTLDALRRRVPRVYRSDRDGTTELTIVDGRIAIRTHR